MQGKIHTFFVCVCVCQATTWYLCKADKKKKKRNRPPPDFYARQKKNNKNRPPTWYHLVISSLSGLRKNPPTSAPEKVMPTRLRDRIMGLEILRWLHSPMLSPVHTAAGHSQTIGQSANQSVNQHASFDSVPSPCRPLSTSLLVTTSQSISQSITHHALFDWPHSLMLSFIPTTTRHKRESQHWWC